MKIVAQLFNLLMIVEIVCTMMFFLFNYASLSTVQFHVQMDPHTNVFGKVVYTFDFTFVVNYYVIFIVVAVIFLVCILLSVNVVGSGLSDTGSSLLIRFLSYLAIYILCAPAMSYYLGAIHQLIPVIFTVMIGFVTILQISAINAGENAGE